MLRRSNTIRSISGFVSAVFLAVVWIIRLGAVEPSHPLSVREADAPCARCHDHIMQSYLHTPMANASGMAADRLHPGTFLHKPSGIEYTIAVRNGRAYLSSRNAATAEPPVEFELRYFLGSGHLGTTYLYSIGDYLFESPIAWYAPSDHYDMKPGLGELSQRPPTLPMQSGCMRCHMSSVQRPAAGTINRYPTAPFLHAGVTCEACHGDSREHVKSNGKVSVINPVRLAADKRDSICISCHLEGDISVERAGRSALDYRRRLHIVLHRLLRLWRRESDTTCGQRSGTTRSEHVQARQRGSHVMPQLPRPSLHA
jgi:hypothetical protein